MTVTPSPANHTPHTIVFPSARSSRRMESMPPATTAEGWTVIVMPRETSPGMIVKLEHQTLSVMRAGHLRLVLDVNRVDWSVEVCRHLVEKIWQRVRLRGGQLRLVAGSPASRRGLRTLRLPGELHVFPTVTSALSRP